MGHLKEDLERDPPTQEDSDTAKRLRGMMGLYKEQARDALKDDVHAKNRWLTRDLEAVRKENEQLRTDIDAALRLLRPLVEYIRSTGASPPEYEDALALMMEYSLMEGT